MGRAASVGVGRDGSGRSAGGSPVDDGHRAAGALDAGTRTGAVAFVAGDCDAPAAVGAASVCVAVGT